MIRKILILPVFLVLLPDFCGAQAFIRTTDLLRRPDGDYRTGELNIIQSPGVDTLLYRYILSNKKQKTSEGRQGMPGFRIQIYASSNRNAREESNKANADFMSKFPDIISYAMYAEPGYFKIRAGNFRTKTEGMKYLLSVRKEFPNAILVPDIINFPDLVKK
ncbi:MAG: hypothetical protein MUO72_04540 [Bacteroidales bacterium]|nr:hypothetical protein [Bacteroidales bacterium]